jgi:hypothetical protein
MSSVRADRSGEQSRRSIRSVMLSLLMIIGPGKPPKLTFLCSRPGSSNPPGQSGGPVLPPPSGMWSSTCWKHRSLTFRLSQHNSILQVNLVDIPLLRYLDLARHHLHRIPRGSLHNPSALKCPINSPSRVQAMPCPRSDQYNINKDQRRLIVTG